ncbi:transcriptional repressor, CopY family [Kribbella flavida DSM 17836]|uniref:Transcriptional repressor, CopY family n=1 Tax=Kribbella flavida (strain DSM 17836 / JCM 10339 / NBRC 14399) TaxID=479435 RepID=D2Q0L4_KRIFD|nr:BlaI/MecI/CopY family transcriptional regulator [Kribbella flavida]ADB33814.1 transcriptional repressor, CopY family [Kribbella flavida DSM 17836]
MTTDPKAPRPLGELERLVMEQLWAADAALTVREVHERLAGTRELAYTTVMTVLDRLAKKQLTERERDGKAWRYRAAAPRADLAADLMRDALDQAGDRREALVRFVGQVSDEEAALLREALSRLEASESAGGKGSTVGLEAREG